MPSPLLDIYETPLFIAESVEKGSSTHNHILTSESDQLHFLKEYTDSSESDVRIVHATKHYFASHGIPVILPIETDSGESYFMEEGTPYAVFPYVQGFAPKYEDLDPVRIHSLAGMLGQVHQAGAKPAISSRNSHLSPDAGGFVQKAEALIKVAEGQSVRQPMDSLFRQGLYAKLQLMDKSPTMPKPFDSSTDHLLHGDYHQGNVFFAPSRAVSHVFDWEKTARGPRLLETLRCIGVACMNGPSEQDNLGRVNEFFRAYDEVYPVDTDCIEQAVELDYMLRLQDLQIETEHYERGNYRLDQFYTLRLARIAYLTKSRLKLVQTLMASQARTATEQTL